MKLELLSRQPAGTARPTPLLFVHGAWHGAWCWAEHFLDDFAAQGYAAHALNLRGHGGSEGRAHLRWTRLADYVADVAEVAAQLPAPPVVIGHSMGGAIVQKYLETHAAPAGILLASVLPAGFLATTLRSAARHPWEFLEGSVRWSLYPLVQTPALAREAFFSAALSEERVRAYHAQLQDESFLAFLDMLVFNLPRPARVQTPLLVLGGAADTVFHPNEIEATARAYGTQATIFPDMAHDMMLEPGWHGVAETMRKWLNGRGL
jgi:alpha-beta hydrolase superfamily lysophospholipase